MTNKKLLYGVIALTLLIAVIGLFTPYLPKAEKIDSSFGSVGNMLAENYIPYIMYNAGFNTEKGITSSGTFTQSGASIFSGAITNSSTFAQGSSGTTINRVNTGTCYLAPTAATVAASTTVAVTCQATKAWNAAGTFGVSALSGVTMNDNVVLTLSSTTAGTTFLGLQVSGASASTTSGYIIVHLTNWTGNTYTWSTTAGVASGTASYIVTN